MGLRHFSSIIAETNGYGSGNGIGNAYGDGNGYGYGYGSEDSLDGVWHFYLLPMDTII
ncbi:hypothetical protein [Pleurocapsa sp. FMAR1]|uniref:hypothetical protein n=1 Tax=Pleurocapsa sp. FMAR1 TaxID=3040204 RepID=UPI0029C7E12E|nr:hypothetical protein [Pleurocapsa sp. FMAR1]